MSLDGLRAWIGEVERKLRMRTRVFLVLTVIAIGIGGAAIYLAVDARDNSVSEGDVQALQEQLEARIGAGGTGGAGIEAAQFEAELKALRAEVEELKREGGAPQKGGGASNEGAADTGSGSGRKESSGATPGGATGGAPSAAELQEQLRRSRESAEEGE